MYSQFCRLFGIVQTLVQISEPIPVEDNLTEWRGSTAPHSTVTFLSGEVHIDQWSEVVLSCRVPERSVTEAHISKRRPELKGVMQRNRTVQWGLPLTAHHSGTILSVSYSHDRFQNYWNVFQIAIVTIVSKLLGIFFSNRNRHQFTIVIVPKTTWNFRKGWDGNEELGNVLLPLNL